MQIILTEEEYNNLKNINKEVEVERFKKELFEKNCKFIDEMVRYFKSNWSSQLYDNGIFGDGCKKIIDKYRL